MQEYITKNTEQITDLCKSLLACQAVYREEGLLMDERLRKVWLKQARSELRQGKLQGDFTDDQVEEQV